MDSRNIEAISFDLDDTLVQYTRPPGDVLQVCFDRLGIAPIFRVEEYYARYDEFAKQCDSMDELRAECFATLAAENGQERHLGREVAAVFSDERDQSNVELLPSVGSLLDELVDEYQIAIVTNGARDAQQKKIEAVSLDQWVETVVIAGHDTPPKPNPEPFERVLQSFESTPATTVHVGDSLETDVAGATAAGLASIWVSAQPNVHDYDPTFSVDSVDEIRPLLLETASESEGN
ncbi:HAD family hydrolase [Halovenus rubra]|uniref:HAD family hydrolase n=2 Tax=Halovenus rubra TaxID=869890 RepID=A0ACC7E4B2_9EURY|nr:HAD family hydrolase [Halovenus rubra]